MTHTLHRFRMRRKLDEDSADYIVMVMAAQGFNDNGAEVKLRQALDILAACDPVNLADDNWGGIYTGETVEGLKDKITGTAYIAAVFADPWQLRVALLHLGVANLGLSVVVTGEPQETWPLIRGVGLDIHTINLSLGVWGNTDRLPPRPILALTSMCGHGLISPAFARDVARRVGSGRLSPREGALELASVCTCGMFNVTEAELLLTRGEVTGDDS